MRTFTITALVATVSASSWTENDGFACAGRNEIDLQDPKSVDGAKAACAANSDCVSFEVLPDGRFQGSSSCTMQVGATAYPGYQLWIKSAAPASAPDVTFKDGDAPKCSIVNGHTVVQYTQSRHPSFKCSHSGNACSCTLKHPTHHDGGCQEYDYQDGKTLRSVSGDCTDTGRNAVDGTWSDWTAQGTCSAACGNGMQTHTRTCDGIVNGGAQCQGNAQKQVTCKIKECPVDGVWSGWTASGSCSAACGNGFQTHTRTCDGKAYGGNDCSGNADKLVTCKIKECPVDGGWSGYGAWGGCSAGCGGGTKYRSRSCTNPSPAHGGAGCGTATTDSASCNTQSCTTYQVLSNGPQCAADIRVTSAAECATAAGSLGYRTSVSSGSWSHAPKGCFVGHAGDGWIYTYFNSGSYAASWQGGRDAYRSFCKKGAYAYKGCYNGSNGPAGWTNNGGAKYSCSKGSAVWYAHKPGTSSCGRFSGSYNSIVNQCKSQCKNAGYTNMAIHDNTACFCSNLAVSGAPNNGGCYHNKVYTGI